MALIRPHVQHLPTLALLLTTLTLHLVAWCWLAAKYARKRWLIHTGGILLTVLLIGGFALRLARVTQFVPPGIWVPWVQAAALGWALSFFAIFASLWLLMRTPRFSPERRKWLKAAAGAAATAPLAMAGYGAFVERSRLASSEIDLRLDGLPPGLDGLRLAQLTDIHLSPFLSVRELSRAVSMANEFRPHIALVTGDLITSPGEWADRCLERLAGLKPTDGTYGCLGNHEVYARAEDYFAAKAPGYGIEFMRSETRSLSFGGAAVNLAGVDYQRLGEPYLRGAERLVRRGEFNILLSHNPDVFPVAADMGFDLTISGHTHGGQLALNLLGYSLNVVRLFTPYVRGLYRRGSAAVYVSRGIGTVGIPVRLGAPPEVTLIRLCAT